MTNLPTLPPVPQVQADILQPYFVALIIDGTVNQIMNLQGVDAARFMAQPKFVQIYQGQAQQGWTYDEATGEFTNPNVVDKLPQLDPTTGLPVS